MDFNLGELNKIKKATSGIFKKSARRLIAHSLLEMKAQVDSIKQLNGVDREEALKDLLNEATEKRHQALQFGAHSYGHPEWAAAAACESWLLELFNGTPESIAGVEAIVEELAMRESSSNRSFDGGGEPKKEQYHPWRRYFARIIDLYIFSFALGWLTILLVLTPEYAEQVSRVTDNIVVAGFIIGISIIPIEAILLSNFGTTPVKWIFGISVKRNNGSNLSFYEAVNRSVLVWMRGVALYVPLFQLIASYLSYRDLTKLGETSWDKDTGSVVSHKEWGALRAISITIFTFIVLISIPTVSMMLENGNKSSASKSNNIPQGENSYSPSKQENDTVIRHLPIEIVNLCHENVSAALLYFTEDSKWLTTGWYTVPRNKNISTTSLTEHNKIYLYAYSNNYTWEGKGNTSIRRTVPSNKFSYFDNTEMNNISGKTVNFSLFNMERGLDNYSVTLRCDPVSVDKESVSKQEKKKSREIPEKKQCAFKTVMTNEDLIACGIVPR